MLKSLCDGDGPVEHSLVVVPEPSSVVLALLAF